MFGAADPETSPCRGRGRGYRGRGRGFGAVAGVGRGRGASTTSTTTSSNGDGDRDEKLDLQNHRLLNTHISVASEESDGEGAAGASDSSVGVGVRLRGALRRRGGAFGRGWRPGYDDDDDEDGVGDGESSEVSSSAISSSCSTSTTSCGNRDRVNVPDIDIDADSGVGTAASASASTSSASKSNSAEEHEEKAQERPPQPLYIPPPELEGDAAFAHRRQYYEGSGMHFANYDDIRFEITSTGAKANSVDSFSAMCLIPLISQNIVKCGYKTPTPIQRHATPQLIHGLDVMACAQTGSGKTAAFLLPIVNVLLSNQSKLNSETHPVKPEAVILAPTRELAIQINREARLYSQNSKIQPVVCYGGAAVFHQRKQLHMGCNILTATPGRLLHFVDEGIVSLENVQFFVLDEADRMLDMGFMGDVKTLVYQMPPVGDRTSALFSATFPIGVQKAAAAFLKPHYVFVVIGIVGGACSDIEQQFIPVERTEKRDKLMQVLKEIPENEKALVFCNEKRTVDLIGDFLTSQGILNTLIHGDRFQGERELALREFTLGDRKVLIATAVAARGLDIPKVSHVINFDLPEDIDEYVQRIGRTGRLGHTGTAVSFYQESEDYLLATALKSILRSANQPIPQFLEDSDKDKDAEDFSLGFETTDHRYRKGRNYGVPVAIEGNNEDDWEY